ncbi:asparagine synthase (glutamine-hydrolyzing) [Gramella lutea]|uniref:asparagine synthase (glutamine-hydrolyzing) n=1 Tax=Christiangramia lutea TaxID=1607951 RepID=A0A9X2A7L6_9FLAO|nr:asparagine synthase (glutamine-hydrolyzing) [Christiangramia lutea]MCH4821574.1 asparagine synthase (glutamine-hydrolyzing) [Christiangramia lutea]
MCGIAGILGAGIKEHEMNLMLKTIQHRGPDSSGIYRDKGFAVLGHNRLSIIDLNKHANQPFSDNSGRYHLSFNGEIYNYKELKSEIGTKYSFRTNSDTEVLLAAFIIYGKDCLNKLNGMFSFAIWDSLDKKMFAARDRFGVKPFYYHKGSSKFVFASEIKAIRTVKPADPNKRVWANYFCFGSNGLPWETFFEGIEQLPAGHFIEYIEGQLSIRKWYDFPDRIKSLAPEFCKSDIKEQYLSILKESLRLRFRADVEVGFNISGGIDSSLLLSLVNAHHKNIKITAFSFYTGDQRYDELPWVEKMISQTGNPLEKVKLLPEEVPEYAQLIANFQEEPFGGVPTIAYAKIFEKARDLGVKVLLDGQGMDEQWAGYDYYNKKDFSLVQGTGKSKSFKSYVLEKEFQEFSEKPHYPEPFTDKLQNLQFRDLFYTKLPRALRFNDRISMAYSTELREPFLDYRLVELAFSLPVSLKIKGGVQKYLLREIIKDYVPDKISAAPKRALQTPQREWLGNELSGFVQGSLSSLKTSTFSSWFDHDKIMGELRKYQAGEKSNSFFLWQWINASLIATNIKEDV